MPQAICPRCQSLVPVGTFCQRCGASLPRPAYPQGPVHKQGAINKKVLIGILGGVGGLILLANISSLTRGNREGRQATTATSTANAPLSGSTKPRPELTNRERIQLARSALTESKSASEMSKAKRELEEIPKEAPEYKEVAALIPKLTERIKAGRAIEAFNLRGRLEYEYRKLIEEANPHLNFVGSKVTKTKTGYALWATHEFFTQYSFSAGDDAKIVLKWIDSNRANLVDAQIVRVGLLGKGPYASSCWLDMN
jgi:hypothetical protein